jgi:hypothetical protein
MVELNLLPIPGMISLVLILFIVSKAFVGMVALNKTKCNQDLSLINQLLALAYGYIDTSRFRVNRENMLQ